MASHPWAEPAAAHEHSEAVAEFGFLVGRKNRVNLGGGLRMNGCERLLGLRNLQSKSVDLRRVIGLDRVDQAGMQGLHLIAGTLGLNLGVRQNGVHLILLSGIQVEEPGQHVFHSLGGISTRAAPAACWWLCEKRCGHH